MGERNYEKFLQAMRFLCNNYSMEELLSTIGALKFNSTNEAEKEIFKIFHPDNTGKKSIRNLEHRTPKRPAYDYERRE